MAAAASTADLMAGVTVVQGGGPGATSWPATPVVSTVSNPSSDTTGESFNGGGGNTNLSQTFTITTTNYILQKIELYASGGVGGGVVLNLYDLGVQTAPNPSSYTSGLNLFGSGAGLPVNLASQAAGILEFDFNGVDAVTLLNGHMYAFELSGTLNAQPTFWERGGSDTYSGGAAYRSQAWINGSSARDFALAVYGTITNGISNPAVSCVVDWNTVYQRIDGFGASSAWRSTWTTAQADLLFSTNTGIGLSLLRSRVAPGGTSVETSIMQMAQARGARVWSTPWSPQTSFKDTNSVNGGNYVSNPANNQAYANQLASYVASMKTSYGINLYALSIQNEPDVNTTNYESCIWNSSQFHDFVPYLYSALSNYGVATTKIILPEDEHWQFNLATNTLNDSSTAAQVSILASHNYGTSATAVNTSGKDLWETEISLLSGSDSSISNGVYWAGQIHQFMTVAQANAWHYWWLITGNSTGNQGLLDTNGAVTKRLYTLGNFSLFVRPNYYRISALNSGAAQVSAYKDPVSGRFAIVAINSSASSITQAFFLTNVSFSSVTPWITSTSLSLASNAPVAVNGGWFTNVLGGNSVVTFAGVANLPANAPTNLSPPAGSTIQSLTPTLQASAFSSPNSGDSQAAAEWLVRDVSTNTIIYDSGTDVVHLISTTLPSALLNFGTTYSWQSRQKNAFGIWSAYSASTPFSTVQPSLRVSYQPPSLVISWPLATGGFSLLYSTNLSSGQWFPVGGTAAQSGGMYVLTNQIPQGQIYYRLKK